ncbi:MAG TPA: hypothetical protein VEU47_11040 [Candidatus Cybelea sp.]|nr:hypothetical protein [Candidatus Cybelea sp.]
MGFLRQRQPQAFNRAAAISFLNGLIAEELAFIRRGGAPFAIEDGGCINPAGHYPIADCRQVVCCHCARIFGK